MSPQHLDPGAAPPPQVAPAEAPLTWTDRISMVLLAVVCLEVGVCLIAFPWTSFWRWNFMSDLIVRYTGNDELWNSPYFKGAVSGVGLVNIMLSLAEFREVFRKRR